jgi:hypothetical protein
LMLAGVVVGVTGLWMNEAYVMPPRDGTAVYLFRLAAGIAMVVSIGLAAWAIRRRNFAEHGAWMTRAYAIGMGAGTQVFTHIPIFIFVGEPEGVPRAAAMGAGWIINVAIAEWVIHRQRSQARRGASVGPLAALARLG